MQTCIKRIRLDMPVLDDDFTAGNVYDSGDNDEDHAQTGQADQAIAQVTPCGLE